MKTDREALMEVLATNDFANQTRGEVADALLAAGWRGPDASETRAWAVVGKDGGIDPETMREMPIEAADLMIYPGDRVVRVAIRVIEEPSDDLPTWDDIRGRAPDATGEMSSEDFVRGMRDGWR